MSWNNDYIDLLAFYYHDQLIHHLVYQMFNNCVKFSNFESVFQSPKLHLTSFVQQIIHI